MSEVVGSVRVVSKRSGGIRAFEGESIIDVDRAHPILGNRHILRNHNDSEERAFVIGEYEVDLENDIARKGPMFTALIALAARAANGEHLALRCWCSPRPCHADLLASKISELAKVPLLQGNAHFSAPPAAPSSPKMNRSQFSLF